MTRDERRAMWQARIDAFTLVTDIVFRTPGLDAGFTTRFKLANK
ncbi:hypothetical protein [Viridibacillus arvi]